MLIVHISGTSSFLCGPRYYHRFFDPWVSILFPMYSDTNPKFLYSIFLTMFNMWNLRRLNIAREVQCTAQGLGDSEKGEFVECGSESPLFRYVPYTEHEPPLKRFWKIYIMRGQSLSNT